MSEFCEECGTYIGRNVFHGGSRQRFCSGKCRVRNFRRLNSIPKDLTSLNRWVRAVGKRPIRCDGRPASSTDSRTWASYKAVRDSSAGDGFGIMLGDDLACWDFDHVNLKAPPSKAVELLPDSIYAEVSSSGAGLHVFVRSSAPSFKRDGVEFYSHSRFVRMTGRRWTR